MKEIHLFGELVQIIERLRDPEKGCPWDLEQTPKSLLPLMLDEVYEVQEAVEEGSAQNLKEELGDLLLHIVMQSQMAKEKGDFSIEEVIEEVVNKLIRRHPHVFGSAKVNSSKEVIENWEKLKEKEGKKKETEVKEHLPSLVSLWRICSDYPELKKTKEELLEELEQLVCFFQKEESSQSLEELLGALLFYAAQLAIHFGYHPEGLLKSHLKKWLDKKERR